MSVNHEPFKQGILPLPLSDDFVNPFISPPPEETLRKGRNTSFVNGKHRKKHRESTSSRASSHQLQSISRKGSATPVATYEYPSDRFTPPREVYVTPVSSTAWNSSHTSRRKSVARQLKLVVKTEPPVIDLSLPPPPPSPTDDPLLLTGPPPEVDRLSIPGSPDAVMDSQEWTKEEWKVLDACFTQECLEAGGRSSPEDVSVQSENVVMRFEQLVRVTPSREELLARTQALQLTRNRRREGSLIQMSPSALPYRRPGLPLPPKELLGKLRGPIVTPARPPIVKPIPPKELVELQPAPRCKPSAIPRLAQPRRLVQLRPVGQQAKSRPISISRPRRSEGESVQDLIRSFEEQQVFHTRRFGYSHRFLSRSEDKDKGNTRPTWKF